MNEKRRRRFTNKWKNKNEKKKRKGVGRRKNKQLTAQRKSTKEIDAQGKIVTPGFIAPMTLIGIVEINSLDVTRDDESEILTAGFSIFNAFNPHSTGIPWNRSKRTKFR